MSGNTQSFENSMAELERILEAISSEDTTLDESIKLYAKAAKLMTKCRDSLEKAKVRITEIDEALDGMGGNDDL